jgi:glycosyltransferase involved in cell wall biosynthesis
MSALTRLDPEPDLRPGEILVVGCVRNEVLRLPDFLAHHRRLGADRFLIVDNASDDGTMEFLRAQDDVCLFFTDESYAQSGCGVRWLNEVLLAYTSGHWTLILDADELFIYPGFETAGLSQLTTWLDARGSESMIAPMLDMYPRGQLSQTGYLSGQSLIAACPWFDGSGYSFRQRETGHSVLYRGGPRHRLFWEGTDRDYPSPVLEKIPLVKWRNDLSLTASTHVMKGAAPAVATGLLLHFKFLQDFAANAAEEIVRGEHFMGARQYLAYRDVMSGAPALSAHWEGSVRYRDSRQFLELGLMQAPDDYPF